MKLPVKRRLLPMLVVLSLACILMAAALSGCSGKKKIPPELDTYLGYLEDLSTFPSAFFYDGESYIGMGGDSFEELNRKTEDFDQGTRTLITLRHKPSGAEILLDTSMYPDYCAFDWTLTFTNNTEQNPSRFSNVSAAYMQVAGADPVVCGSGGDAATYYTPYEKPVVSEISFQCTTGRPSHPVFPYYNLKIGEGGMFIAVGWPGNYFARFEPKETEAGEAVLFAAGQADVDTHLKPGESFRTPLMAFVLYPDRDAPGLSNAWRSWYIDCCMPQPDGENLKPLLSAATSWYFNCMTTAEEKSQISFIDMYFSHDVKLDYWWMDAGWYEGANGKPISNWPETGIWKVDTDRFPTKFAAVSAKAHEYGAKTLVWFEPEVCRIGGAAVKAANPDFNTDWLLGNTLLNLGEPAAVDWTLNRVLSIMEEGDISVYRQDYNIDPAGYWTANDSPNQKGMTENRYVSGYLDFWDGILERRPGTLIDSCASGGGRNDLETMKRSVPLHRTDFAVDSDYNRTLSATQTLYNWLPYSGAPSNYRTDMRITPYTLRALYIPSLTLNYDPRSDALDWELLSALSQEWRMAMSYWDKDYYELFPTSAANNTWKGWQFFDSKKNQGVIQVFCPEGSGELSQKVKLYSLNPKKTYVLTDSDGLNSYKAKGSELMEEGLPISYNRTFSSSVIFISTKEVETPALLKEYAAEYNGLTLPAIQEGDVVVSDLPYESWIMYEASSDEANPKYKPNFNTNENGGTLIVGGIPFLKGIRSHPRLHGPADIVYDISAYSDDYSLFRAYVGKEGLGGPGKIQFEVLADGKSVAKSSIFDYGEGEIIEANIAGCKKLTLRILDGGDGYTNDSSAFGNPVLTNPEADAT